MVGTDQHELRWKVHTHSGRKTSSCTPQYSPRARYTKRSDVNTRSFISFFKLEGERYKLLEGDHFDLKGLTK